MQNVCRIVPEKTAFVVERFGKFNKTLSPGIHILIPFVSYQRHCENRWAFQISQQHELRLAFISAG